MEAKINTDSVSFFEHIFFDPEPSLTLVVGSQATGKTVSIKNILPKYRKNFPKKEIKILSPFFDEYNEYKQPIISKLALDIPHKKLRELYEEELFKSYDSLVVVEYLDLIYSEQSKSLPFRRTRLMLPGEIIGIFSIPRTRRNHFIVTLQSLSDICPKLLGVASYIIYHGSNEHERDSKNFPPSLERIHKTHIVEKYQRVLFDMKEHKFII